MFLIQAMAKQMLKNANKGKVIGKKKQASASSKYFLYLLRGGPKQKHAYVGVTNKNPQLRLKQHNGLLRGGAAPTAKYRGTWWLHLVVCGLKSKKAALVLEHAVQQPTTPPGFLFHERRLKGLLPFSEQFTAVRKRCKDIKAENFASGVEYRERVITELLQMDLWRPLTVRHVVAAPVPAAIIDLTAESDIEEIVEIVDLSGM